MIMKTDTKTRLAIVPWSALLAFALPFSVQAQLPQVSAQAQPPQVSGEVRQHVETAIEVFDSLVKLNLPPHQRALLDEALKDAHGFVIFPRVLKVGAGVSTIQGRGVLSYRDRDGEWSPPIPLLVQGTSSGPHFGAVIYDSLVVIKTPAAIERILSGQLSLEGREAIGPVQQAISPQQDIVAYTRPHGLTMGLSADDIHITLNQQAIKELYGREVEPREIVSGQKMTMRASPCVQKFVETSSRVAGKSPRTIYWK
jgi:lipid-binding SYLF domain-containing protein